MKIEEKYKTKGKSRGLFYRKSPLESQNWEGKIERLAWGGLGVSHLEDGRVLLLEAPLALFPHEVVRAIIRQKSKHAEGEVISWIEPSPLRTPSKCTVADQCGGCQLHESGDRYSVLKQSMVEDLFRRMLPNQPWEWLPAPADALRQRIQLHWDGESIGFHQRKKKKIVPIASCPAATSCISESIPRLKEAVASKFLPSRPQRWELATGTPPMEVFAIDDSLRAWALEPDGWHRTEKSVIHDYCGHRLSHRPGGFFQVSAQWAMKSFQDVFTKWGIQGDTLYDLYGGVGLFSAIIGGKFNSCILVESNSDSIAHARHNLSNARLSHICVESDVTNWMPDGLGCEGDVILLDPPRAGLTNSVTQKLLKSKAGTIVIIGCDGATFCRDIQRLAHLWKIQKIAVIDLFPMTAHVECVGLMQLQ
ncbi:MAG: hypothetical protein FWG12_03530 [Holophagaceae bacterium]|nr:hypothetical protein [Holophagaceae bacterium]